MTAVGPLPTVRRHPFRGLVGGALFGVGASLWLVLFGVIALGTWPPLLIAPLLALAGLAWGLWGPVRGGGGPVATAVPTYNERVQQALAENESAIERGRAGPAPEARELPGIGPPARDDHTDWHRRPPGEGGPSEEAPPDPPGVSP